MKNFLHRAPAFLSPHWVLLKAAQVAFWVLLACVVYAAATSIGRVDPTYWYYGY